MIIKQCPFCKADLRDHLKELHKGANNPMWKGDKVKYSGIHMWVIRNFGRPTECEKCRVHGKLRKDGRNGIQWANLSGTYTRERSDWTALCAKCHTQERSKHGESKYRKGN